MEFIFIVFLISLAVKFSSAELTDSISHSQMSTIYLCKDFSKDKETNFIAEDQWKVPSSLLVNGSPGIIVKLAKQKNDLQCLHRIFERSVIIGNNSDNSQRLHILSNGYLSNETRIISQYIEPSKFCVKRISVTSIDIKFCELRCTVEEPCIRKCCQFNELYSLSQNNAKCVPNRNTQLWNTTMYTNAYDSNSQLTWPLLENNLTQTGIGPSKSNPNPWIYIRTWSFARWKRECNGENTQIISYRIENLKLEQNLRRERFRVQTNGEIFSWNIYSRDWQPISRGPFCIESTPEEHVLITCIPKSDTKITGPIYYGTIHLITSLFALATFISHILLWEKQNIHSWTVMTFSMALFVGFFLLGIAHLISAFGQALIETTFCKLVGTFAHFFFLATFCWLMIISLDLYLTFREMLVTKSKGKKRYLLYSTVGWGIPLIVVIVSWILELIYGNDYYSSIKVPAYGKTNCHLARYVMYEYVYRPTFIMYLLNIIFFCLTLCKLWEIKKSTTLARKDSKKDRQAFVLFVKLFFVIGVLWIIEFCGYYFSSGETTWYWMILDLCNCLQPVSLFIIFVIKMDVLNSLSNKYPILQCLTNPMISWLKWLESKFVPSKKSQKFERICMSGASNASGSGTNSSTRSKSTFSTESTIYEDDTEL